MLIQKSNNGMKTIAIPVISFSILGALIMGAVLYGNLVDRADGCRPIGSDSKTGASDDRATLLVYSNEDGALMLCDVPQETVEYDPPQRSDTGVQIGDSLYRIASDSDLDESFAVIEGSDRTRDASRYASEENSVYEGIFRVTLTYLNGEFGSLENCGFSVESYYESDDFDGFDGSDMFHPDRIQSCWIEIEELIDEG